MTAYMSSCRYFGSYICMPIREIDYRDLFWGKGGNSDYYGIVVNKIPMLRQLKSIYRSQDGSFHSVQNRFEIDICGSALPAGEK